MTYLLYVFGTRRDAMALYDLCLRRRLPVSIVNTPREVSASCGISLRCMRHYPALDAAARRMPTHVGTFLVREGAAGMQLQRL